MYCIGTILNSNIVCFLSFCSTNNFIICFYFPVLPICSWRSCLPSFPLKCLNIVNILRIFCRSIFCGFNNLFILVILHLSYHNLIPVTKEKFSSHFSAILSLSFGQLGGTHHLRKSGFCHPAPKITVKSTDLQVAYEIFK